MEIGCGAGDLARALARQGHTVTAIDPEAPDGTIFRRVSFEEFSDDAPFDAVIANRSLHHIHDLDAALAKVHSLLDLQGLLILNEFAWDQMDETTARWYLAHVTEPKPHDTALQPENFPDMWVAERGNLHKGSVMKDGLERAFHTEVFEWIPYIARHYLDNIALEKEEAVAIAQGLIRPIGFRYVGRKTSLSAG